jgi:hypothetical protein
MYIKNKEKKKMLGKKVLNICSKKNKRGKELKDKIMSV